MKNEHMDAVMPNSWDRSPPSNSKYPVNAANTSKIRVTVHIPDNIYETIRQQKINRTIV